MRGNQEVITTDDINHIMGLVNSLINQPQDITVLANKLELLDRLPTLAGIIAAKRLDHIEECDVLEIDYSKKRPPRFLKNINESGGWDARSNW